MLNWRDPDQQAAGGAEVYAWEVARGLVGAGAAVDFLTSRERGQPVRELREGVRFRRRGGRWTVYPAALLRLAATRLSGRRYDAVLDCQNGIPFFAPLAVGRRIPVVLVVHHVHDAQFGVHFPRPVAALGRWLEGPASRWVYRRCVAVAVSPSTVRAMRERLRWRGVVAVVPNGVRAPEAPPAVQSAAAPAAPSVVAVGRLVRHKRLEQVAGLADQLAGARPGVRVHIVGRGPDEDRVRAAVAALRDPARAVVHGYLPQPAKDALLHTATLHVSASQGEGWGLSVLEAAALGVPTVAHDVDGLRDAIRDGRTGWLTRPGETLAEAAARALADLADPARAAAVRRECLAWAARFDWPSSVAALATLLARELSAAAAPGRSSPSRTPAVPAPARPSGATTGDSAGRLTGSAHRR